MYEYLSSDLFKCIILFLIFVCFISLYVLHQIVSDGKRVLQQQNPKVVASLDANSDDLEQNKKVDCQNETIFTFSDEQCHVMCMGEYVARNGICVNKVILNYEQASNNVCDMTKGLISYMLGDGQLGTIYMHCLSIDPGIQPDDANKDNIILKGGIVEINYKKSFPQYKNGKCHNYNDQIVAVPSTMNVRDRGICIEEKKIKFISY